MGWYRNAPAIIHACFRWLGCVGGTAWTRADPKSSAHRFCLPIAYWSRYIKCPGASEKPTTLGPVSRSSAATVVISASIVLVCSLAALDLRCSYHHQLHTFSRPLLPGAPMRRGGLSVWVRLYIYMYVCVCVCGGKKHGCLLSYRSKIATK